MTLSVDVVTDESFVTIYERLARQAAGLQLDGIEGRVYGFDVDEDGEA